MATLANIGGGTGRCVDFEICHSRIKFKRQVGVAGATTRHCLWKVVNSFWAIGWKRWPPVLSVSTEHLHFCATVLSNNRTTTQLRTLVVTTLENGAPQAYSVAFSILFRPCDECSCMPCHRELWDEYFRFDLELDYDAPPNRIDGRAVEKGWRRRQAEALEAEVREEHPNLSDEEVLIECERRS